LLLICALLIGVQPVAAEATDAASAAKAAELPELPRAPSLELPRPEPDQLEQVDRAITRLQAGDQAEREQAARELLESSPSLVPAVRHRLERIADRSDKEAMKNLLGDIRSEARNDLRLALEAEGKRGAVETPDYLQMVISDARPRSKAWPDLVAVLGLSRMLTAIGTIKAARELVTVYVRFGEFLRVDTQLQLEKLGDRAVAALIEARRHPAEKIARWAERQLDALGKAIPGEAVQVEDPEVLGDILRAYGRIKTPEATRIIVSFANSERAQLREAARQAISLMGEVGHWQLRDAYENTTGKRPPRDWSWDRTARQLFAELDRARQAQVYKLYDEGIAARKARDLERMRQTFDKVLARSPNFQHAEELAAGYLEYARALPRSQRTSALVALGRAERLTKNEAEKRAAQSLKLTLQGEELLERGIVDQALLRRATELDAANTRASELLARALRGETPRAQAYGRYAAAAAIGGVALLAIAFIALRRPKPSSPEPEPDPAPPPGAA
jgi:hypothetical protein